MKQHVKDQQPALSVSTRLAGWLSLSLAVLIADQVTKIWFNAQLYPGQRIHMLPFFDFTLMFNPGAAFSFLASQPGWQRWFFTAIGVAASGFILWLMLRSTTKRRLMLALSLILGGAIGNVIDRIAYGHVIDFLLFYWDNWYYPAFNLADTAISLGAVLLIIDELLSIRGQRARS
jgi:signal peptidase II